jgi:hypothetical protein
MRWVDIQSKNFSCLCNRDVVSHHLLLLDWVASCGKDDVQFFQRSLLGLDKEEVDDGAEAGVEDRKDDVLHAFEN